jgi:hypothetical protein
MGGAPVQVNQYRGEFEGLIDVFRQTYDHLAILEIGTHYGGTLWHWANLAPGATIVAVDLYHINEHLYRQWEEDLGVTIVAIKGDSTDPLVVDTVRNYGPFSWVFIDGGHDLETVSKDYVNYGPMSTSIIALHDILEHPVAEVSALWHRIKISTPTAVELVTDSDQDGCGIGYVRVENLVRGNLLGHVDIDFNPLEAA